MSSTMSIAILKSMGIESDKIERKVLGGKAALCYNHPWGVPVVYRFRTILETRLQKDELMKNSALSSFYWRSAVPPRSMA